MDDLEEENTEKESLYLTFIHTHRQSYRPSDEACPRGAFAPKNTLRQYTTTLYRTYTRYQYE